MENSFAKIHPELVGEWSDKNHPLTASDVTYGSNKLRWWKGACGHEWQASPKSRSVGKKCPICSGARAVSGVKDLATLKPELVSEWSIRNKKLKPTMVTVGSNKKIVWQGKCGHEWTATVRSRAINGTGCPYCSHNAVLEGFNDLASEFPQVAAEWSERNFPLLPTQVTAFANKKVWWKCAEGHEWNALISIRSGGSKCPYCSGLVLLKGFNDFATRQPLLAQEWSNCNLPLTPDMVNEKSRKNVWWKCKKCGNEWRSLVQSRIKGTECPVCADRAVMTGYNDLATTDSHLLREWDYEKNKDLFPTEISRYSMKPVWWKCNCGHSWKAKISERTIEGVECKVCEQEYVSVFPKLIIGFYARKKGLRVLNDSDKVIGLLLETYIPEEKLAIESCFDTEINEKLKEYICKRQGIKLVKIPFEMGLGESKYAHQIKKTFQNLHIYISSDENEDVDFIRKSFFEWKRQQQKREAV